MSLEIAMEILRKLLVIPNLLPKSHAWIFYPNSGVLTSQIVKFCNFAKWQQVRHFESIQGNRIFSKYVFISEGLLPTLFFNSSFSWFFFICLSGQETESYKDYACYISRHFKRQNNSSDKDLSCLMGIRERERLISVSVFPHLGFGRSWII